MMPTAEPVQSESTLLRAARALFVFRVAELAFTILNFVAMRLVLPRVSTSLMHAFDVGEQLAWVGFGAVHLALLAMLRRELGDRGPARLAGTAVALAAVDLVLGLCQVVPLFGGPEILSFPGDAGRALMVFLFVGLGVAFDFVFWLLLSGLLGEALAPWLRLAFFTLRGASALLGSLSLLPFETYRAWILEGPIGVVLPWLRIMLTITWSMIVILTLKRLSRGVSGLGATDWIGPRENGQRDIWVGVAWLAGGLLVTGLSYSAAAASPGGGRYLVTTGAIVYGAVRLVRGLSRLGNSNG
jgi:hypothetical protein